MQKYYILIDTENKKRYEFTTKKELYRFLCDSSIINWIVKEEWYGISI